MYRGRKNSSSLLLLFPSKTLYIKVFGLIQAWEAAVKLAMGPVRERLPEVAVTVSARLASIGRHDAAADLLLNIDDVPGAIR